MDQADFEIDQADFEMTQANFEDFEDYEMPEVNIADFEVPYTEDFHNLDGAGGSGVLTSTPVPSLAM